MALTLSVNPMKLVILDGHAVNPGDLSWDLFSEYAEITVYEKTPQDLVAERIGDAEAVFLNKIVINREILEKCPNLRYIGVLATGYNVIDLEATRERGITVTNIPAYSTNSVAQHTFAFILHFTNLVSSHNASVQNGDWVKCPHFCYWNAPLTELEGKTLGILGYGNIGKQVERIAEAFGMKCNVLLHHPNPSVKNACTQEVFFRDSDFITLHAPLTDETKEFINKESISKMKDGVIIINTARGPLVNEKDVRKALESGKLKGYAADVVCAEPMLKDNPLLGAPNCIITPHIAWAPLETRKRLMQIALDNLKGYLNGKPVNTV